MTSTTNVVVDTAAPDREPQPVKDAYDLEPHSAAVLPFTRPRA